MLLLARGERCQNSGPCGGVGRAPTGWSGALAPFWRPHPELRLYSFLRRSKESFRRANNLGLSPYSLLFISCNAHPFLWVLYRCRVIIISPFQRRPDFGAFCVAAPSWHIHPSTVCRFGSNIEHALRLCEWSRFPVGLRVVAARAGSHHIGTTGCLCPARVPSPGVLAYIRPCCSVCECLPFPSGSSQLSGSEINTPWVSPPTS